MSKLVGQIFDALDLGNDYQLEQQLGIKIGKLYTNHGLPIDIALSKLSGLSKEQRTAVLDGALSWLVEHRRQSGASEQAIDRQRTANRHTMERFLGTGETGVY